MTDQPASQRLTMTLSAEDLVVTRRRTTRQVIVRRLTDSRDVEVAEPLADVQVEVQHVALGHFVDAVPEIRQDGDVTIIPIVEEVLVVERRLRLKEEVHVRRTRVDHRHAQAVTLRAQHATVMRSDPTVVTLPSQSRREGVDDGHISGMTDMASETIVAVYDTAAHAEQAIADLVAANVSQSAIQHHSAQGSHPAGAATGATTTRTEEKSGFWSNLFGGDSGDETLYSHSVETGATVVTVTITDDQNYDRIVGILERHSPIDMEQDPRYAGLSTSTAQGAGVGAGVGPALPIAAATTGAVTGATAARLEPGLGRGTATTEQGGTLELAEESLSVGKRVVNRGGTRIRRYVVERPVEETVSLHDEKVTLERHKVTDGRTVGTPDFSEATLELTETAEEAVVAKTARVTEEITLGKTATERTETIRDTLRKEEVEVEQIPGTATATTTTTTATTLPPAARPKV